MEALNSAVAWIVAHESVFCVVSYAILNEVVNSNKSIASNSIIEMVLNFLKSKQPPAAS